MSRAKRIEEAARAVEVMLREQEPHRKYRHSDVEMGPEGWSLVDALRDALALPEEESEVGWMLPRSLDDLRRRRPMAVGVWPALAEGVTAVRVRITVEGEESER